MPLYKFYWKNGKIDEANGKNASEAFVNLGCCSKDLTDLHHYEKASKKRKET